jgi:acetylornithine deacetylase/succinyl-diaminopimelate desuccinylase-like protein
MRLDLLRYAALAPLLLTVGNAARAETSDLTQLQDEAVVRLQEYVRIDTTNPPGNESRGIAWLAQVLEREGIAYQTAESAPGRGNLWARLDPDRKPAHGALVLLHHVDVVPADRRYWTSDPFAGEIRDGYVYGRGTLDTKAFGVAQLQAFIALNRARSRLERPVVFVAVADEEAGGAAGTGWLLERHPEVFADTEWVLNEGGLGLRTADGAVHQVEVTQKIPLWLELIARGDPAHGSRPPPESAVTRLVHALERISRAEFAPREIPPVAEYLRASAAAGLDDTSASALTRDTCAITRLTGSPKINVIPPEARAEIDCRLLPDRDPDDFLAELRTLIGDPAVEIRELMRFSPGVSTTDTALYRAIVDVAAQGPAPAPVIPLVATGFTDSHFFRDRGIVAYGYAPFVIPQGDLAGIHGNDERIAVAELRTGVHRLYEILERVVF